MKIVENRFIPFKGFKAINLFGVLFCRKGTIIDEVTLNHEKIHTAQMKELLYIFFYVLYALEYILKLVEYSYGSKAYRMLSFEVEAYANEKDENYLQNRKRFAWLKYY